MAPKEKIETGTVARKGHRRRFAAVRITTGKRVEVRAARGHNPQEAYYGTNAATAATFEPDTLTLSGSITPRPAPRAETR